MQETTPAAQAQPLPRPEPIRHAIKTLGGSVLFEAELPGDTPSGLVVRAALEQATTKRAYLSGADLRGADLSGAYLRGADLRGALLDGKKLIGDRPVLQIGPIGSREDYFLAFITEDGVKVQAGCFCGSLADFEIQCAETHGDNEHAREYKAALALIQVHADIWTPKAEEAQPVAEAA